MQSRQGLRSEPVVEVLHERIHGAVVAVRQAGVTPEREGVLRSADELGEIPEETLRMAVVADLGDRLVRVGVTGQAPRPFGEAFVEPVNLVRILVVLEQVLILVGEDALDQMGLAGASRQLSPAAGS